MSLKKILVILSSICLLAGCSLGGIWSSPPLRAQIVAEDGVPVKGAVVVGTWEAVREFHNASLGYFEVQETTTDEQGWFTMPGFKPRYVRDKVLPMEPQILIIHKDYKPVVLVNSFAGELGQAPTVLKFYMQDRQIRLAPRILAAPEMRSAVVSASLKLQFYFLGTSEANSNFCVWEKMPKFLVEFERLRVDLKSEGHEDVAGFITPIRNAISWDRTKCGDASKILKELANENEK